MSAPDEPLFLPGGAVSHGSTAPPPTQARRRTYIPLCIRDIETVRIPIEDYPEGAETCEPTRRP